MAKIAIVLCALLVATVSHAAENVLNDIKLVEKKAQEALDEAIASAMKEHENMYREEDALNASFTKDTKRFRGNVENEIAGIMSRLSAQVKTLDDTTGCTEYLDQIAGAVDPTRENTLLCIDTKSSTRTNSVTSFTKVFEDEFMGFALVKQNTMGCNKDGQSVQEALNAITKCAITARNKAKWIKGTFIPQMRQKVATLRMFETTFVNSLEQCVQLGGLQDLRSQAATVIDKTKRCMEKRVKYEV